MASRFSRRLGHLAMLLVAIGGGAPLWLHQITHDCQACRGFDREPTCSDTCCSPEDSREREPVESITSGGDCFLCYQLTQPSQEYSEESDLKILQSHRELSFRGTLLHLPKVSCPPPARGPPVA